MESNSFWRNLSSILETILSDLFLVISDFKIAGYADDNIFYDSAESVDNVTMSLQESRKRAIQMKEILKNVI